MPLAMPRQTVPRMVERRKPAGTARLRGRWGVQGGREGGLHPDPDPAPHLRGVQDGSDVVIPRQGPKHLHHRRQVLLAAAEQRCGCQGGAHAHPPPKKVGHPSPRDPNPHAVPAWGTPRNPPVASSPAPTPRLPTLLPCPRVWGGGMNRTPNSGGRGGTHHSPPLHGGALFPLAPGVLEQADQDAGHAAGRGQGKGCSGPGLVLKGNPHPKQEEPDEVQQGQGQGPAPGEEQPQVPVQAGGDLLESSSAERDWECWGTTG